MRSARFPLRSGWSTGIFINIGPLEVFLKAVIIILSLVSHVFMNYLFSHVKNLQSESDLLTR